MAQKKRPGERWFQLAPEVLWSEHETPEDDSYVPKEGNVVLAWSFLVVKAAQYKILFAVKVGTPEKHTWSTLTGWEVTSVQALGDHVDVVLENSAVQNAHMFMHQFVEPFDAVHAKESCVEPETIKPETIFIDTSVSNTKVASRFTKLKQAITVLNKANQSKPRSAQPVRRKATTEEGAGSSRPQTVRKPRPVPADSRRTSPTATPAVSETPTPSGSRQSTPSKRTRDTSVMTDEAVSPELRMPKPGQPVDAGEIQKIVDNFTTKCSHCFFMGRDFQFDVDISQCHLAPPEKCVRAKEDEYVNWIISQIVSEQYRDARQTIVVMPQGLKKMPTPEMWPEISKGDFWLIDGQHSVEASKKIQLMDEWADPNNQKEKLKFWKALVVWSDDDTKLSDISRYFNMGNKKRAYQASWIRNIMASREVWEFYGRPPRERENAKDKNPKWEVSMVWVGRPKLFLCSMLILFLVWVGRPKPFIHLYSLGRSTQTHVAESLPDWSHISNTSVFVFHMQDFKYQMINKFSSIDNASSKQKKYNDMRGEIYLITASDSVWQKWRSVFERHEKGELIDPDTGVFFNASAKFRHMKPLVREFFRSIQGLSETEMEKAASHILHQEPTAKRCWAHPKIVFQKPKTFLPSCYSMKEWTDNRKKKTTIVMELHKLVPEKKIIVDDEVHGANWRAFKKEYKFTSASMAALIREAGEDFLLNKRVKGGKNMVLPEHTLRAFSNFIKEKRVVCFEGSAHFNPVTFEPLKIQGWPGPEARMAIRTKAGGRFPFGMIDFRNIPYGSTEGAMTSPFYDRFLAHFVDYGCPRFREVDIWLWIVEDKKSEQVYELVRKLQSDYAVSKAHYVANAAEGAYTSLRDKKTKTLNLLCLYFVYKAELLNIPNHPMSRMDKLFQIQESSGTNRSLYDEAKYANYPTDELRMEFYLRMLRTLTRRGDCVFNVFGGTKPIYAALVSHPYNHIVCFCGHFLVWVDRPKPWCVLVWVDRPKPCILDGVVTRYLQNLILFPL